MFSGCLRHASRLNLRQNAFSLRPGLNPVASRRHLRIPSQYLTAATQRGALINFLGACYFGGLAVCLGLLYWLYSDADSRQSIPFELKFTDQRIAVEAINKDDVCRSPQFAVKHYRRLLKNLASYEKPENLESLENSSSIEDPDAFYDFPMIKSKVLLHEKSAAFANFYMDMVLRYAKALLSRGKDECSRRILRKIVNNDELFYRLGNAEKLAEDCRFLAQLHEDPDTKVAYLIKSIDMLTQTFPSIKLDSHWLLQKNSKVTNELVSSLNDLAFTFAQASKNHRTKDKKELLGDALNIYLANLQKLTDIQHEMATGTVSKTNFPLFDVSPSSLNVKIAEIKAHISEIVWAKGYKKNAIGWSEDVVDMIYYEHNSSDKIAPILLNTLNNLSIMYGQMKDKTNQERCERMKQGIAEYDSEMPLYYDTVLGNFSKIIYSRGPLGIIEKSLKERYGPTRFAPNLEEFDDLDEED